MDGNGSLFGTVSGNTREVRSIPTLPKDPKIQTKHTHGNRKLNLCHVPSVAEAMSPPIAGVQLWGKSRWKGVSLSYQMPLIPFSSGCGHPDPGQVQRGAAQEARARRAVSSAFCTAAHGEAAQLRPQGEAHDRHLRQASPLVSVSAGSCYVWVDRFQGNPLAGWAAAQSLAARVHQE